MSGWGALLGLAAASGVLLVVSFAAGRRPPTVLNHIRPYVASPIETARRPAPSMLDVARQLVARRGSVQRPKARLVDADTRRAERVLWTAAGGLVGAGIGVVAAVGGGSVVATVILSAVGAAAGRLARDRSLAHEERRRSRLIDAQMPATVELIALAVAAGEPVVGAMERVGSVTHEPLGPELIAAVADVRSGAAVEAALDSLARRCGCRSVERFTDGLVVAIERGTPLASILRSQASDARADALRRLMESAGRKDALMLVPVVFLVLPTVIAIALFPGIQTLRLVVP